LKRITWEKRNGEGIQKIKEFRSLEEYQGLSVEISPQDEVYTCLIKNGRDHRNPLKIMKAFCDREFPGLKFEYAQPCCL
jgi:hypothetical protein